MLSSFRLLSFAGLDGHTTAAVALLAGLLVAVGCGSDDSGADDLADVGGSDDLVAQSDTDDDGGGVPDTTIDVAGGACGNAPGQMFPPGAPWNTAIDDAPTDGESDAIIGFLQSNHDTGTRFQIDFSIITLEASSSTERRAFDPTGDHYSPDCDTAPVPVPEGGAIEGETGYACDSDGDCHLIVRDSSSCRLYEMWRANITGADFAGGCLAVWDIDRVYPEDGRGEHCTSADAAGLPIAPLLVTPDEVAAGRIEHALRYILPNAYIRDRIYVRPATHSTGATSGGGSTPPYGARLRLRADTDISGLNAAAQVVAQALMDYGMFLADGGNLTFTFGSDRVTTADWDGVGLGPHDLKGLSWSDFEVVELGERFTWTGDCNRQVVSE